MLKWNALEVHYAPLDDKVQPEKEPLIKLVPREEWGAMPPKTTTSMTIPATHVRYNQTHTDSCMDREECAQVLQKIQKEQMEVKGFNDIQYHFMIGGDGTVYEGRGWQNKGEHHPGIKEKEYYDVAYIGSYPKNQVPILLLSSLYDFLDQIEASGIVTVPFVLFNDMKELEKTPDDLQTHELFGHVKTWGFQQTDKSAFNTVLKKPEEIEWTPEEIEKGYDKNDLKLTPEELDYLFADKKFTTEEEDKARVDAWMEKNRSYYEPHYADVMLQEAKDEYEKKFGVKYDDDVSERSMRPMKPEPPPRVYQDPKEAHGEESIITRMENIMRPGAHRFDKYGKEIPMKGEKENVTEEVKVDSERTNNIIKNVKKGRKKKQQTSQEDIQATYKEPNSKNTKHRYSKTKSISDTDQIPGHDEYGDERRYSSNYSYSNKKTKRRTRSPKSSSSNLGSKGTSNSNYNKNPRNYAPQDKMLDYKEDKNHRQRTFQNQKGAGNSDTFKAKRPWEVKVPKPKNISEDIDNNELNEKRLIRQKQDDYDELSDKGRMTKYDKNSVISDSAKRKIQLIREKQRASMKSNTK